MYDFLTLNLVARKENARL